MNREDMGHFTEILDSLSDYYQRDPLKPMAVKIYFKALEAFSMDQIGDAVTMHLQDTTAGKYYPKASDLITHIEGGVITAEYIVAAAQLANSPLGIVARIHIGTWDLNNLNSFDLKQRAAECLQLLPKWKAAAMAGNYSDHTISIMIKHGVSPVAPFAMGIAGPTNPSKLIEQANYVIGTDKHKQMLEDPWKHGCEDHVEVTAQMAELLQRELKVIGRDE